MIQVDGFKIFDGTNGLFVKAPAHEGKNKEGERAWYDDVKFIGDDGKPVDFKDKESAAALCRDEIFKSMIEAYHNAGDEPQSTPNTSRADAARAQSDDNSKSKRRPLW